MAKKIKRYKVGCDSETYAISMVDMPAIESDFVALEKQEEEKVQVFLESNERHMVYGAALIPDKDIYRNNGEQEFYISFTKESIEKMSQEFMKEYRQNEVTLDHEEMANDITITESWLVEDPYKDKANALGINVPQGTWMIGMKVNQIDVWERVKSGELKGFSVESMISLEEFSKNDNNMNIETNDMGFWSKMKEVLEECFSSPKVEETELAANSGFSSVEDYKNEVEAIKEELAEETPAAEAQPTVEAPKVDEPKAEENPIIDGGDPHEILAPKAEEPKQEEAPKEEPKAEDNHLEELIKNLKEEIAALKNSNGELQERIKDLGKQPSAAPINTNAKPNASSTYSAWREQMAKYM